MEFERDADGTLTPLPAPSIDTGMGLERVTAVLQRKDSNYDTDLFTPILTRIGELSGRTYAGTTDAGDVSMRVVADHIRATTFLIADGVVPSNEWRGYVLRKIMRRAMRHGKHLGIAEPFLHRLVEVLDREMGNAYPEVRANRAAVEKTILAEERRFDAVLTGGLPRLESEIAKALESPERVLPGDAAFRLYDTFGLPYDFIEDTAATQDLTLDREGFEKAMEGQRHRARAKNAFETDTGSDSWAGAVGEQFLATEDAFRGYSTTRLQDVPIVQLFDATKRPVSELAEGTAGFVSLEKTPFYVESGGQVSDTGRITGPGTEAAVQGVVRIPANRPRAHQVQVMRGTLHVGDLVTTEVDSGARDATRRNHTATHLLHAALRDVLGSHVRQAGSLVAPGRLRFDFAHSQPVTAEEQERIERIVNEQIRRNVAVDTQERPTQEAMAAGAMALFGEKYGETVRVVSVPGFSMELCGGTHVRATGDIGFFAVLAESGVAAGVRRIEAATGAGAVEWAQQQRAALLRVVSALHVNEDQSVDTIEKLLADNKRLAREASQLKTKLALGTGSPAAGDGVIDVGSAKLARRKVSGLDKDALRSLADSLKARIESGVVVIASENEGKVQIVVAVTPDLTTRIKAGQIVKEIAPIVGGGGGGRPDFAEAGGKQPDKIDELLHASESVVAKLLGQV
jgi:alanyl-tRNA synthetase